VIRQTGYAIDLEGGETRESTSVILATPSFVVSELLADVAPELRKPLSGIEHVSTAIVTLAFRTRQLGHPLNGSGYIKPRAEGGPVVACSWTSSKFDNRAPPGHALMRVFIGRAGLEDVVQETDDALVDVACGEVFQSLGIRREPVLTRVRRWPRGLPQYTLGHVERVAQIDREIAKYPGLELAGASYKGVGIPDCIESGWAAAERVSRSLSDGI
jgi:oxygen-dependent protoporphyrinogen oxidase